MGRRGGQLLRGTPALPAPDLRAAVRGWNGGPAAGGLVPLVVVVPWLGPWGVRGSVRPAGATVRVRGLSARRQIFLP